MRYRLAQQYSAQRMEAAAERALLAKACRYQEREVNLEELAGHGSLISTTTRLPAADP